MISSEYIKTTMVNSTKYGYFKNMQNCLQFSGFMIRIHGFQQWYQTHNITFLFFQVTNKGEILPQTANKMSMIVCSTGSCGTIKFWNVDSSLITKTDKRKALKSKRRYTRPPALDIDMSPLQKLYRKWPAFLTVIIHFL